MVWCRRVAPLILVAASSAACGAPAQTGGSEVIQVPVAPSAPLAAAPTPAPSASVRAPARYPDPPVLLVGQSEVSRDDILDAILPGGGTPFDADRASLFLLALYYDRGYLEATVDPPTTQAGRPRFRIHEGKRYRIRSIHIRDHDEKPGDPLGDPALLRGMIRARAGEWFSRRTLVEDLGAIRRRYRDEGYAMVEADPETDMDKRQLMVGLSVPIRRGPITTIDRVDVVGNVHVADATIRGLVLVHAGDRFHETKLEDSKKALLAFPPLERVDVSTAAVPGHADRLVVTFEVKER